MLSKVRNYFVKMNIDESIEFIFEEIDAVQSDIEDLQLRKEEVPAKLVGELTAYQNAVRRLRKLKEKYN